MAGIFEVPRTRGALTGTLLVLLGIWGGLIPFVGPHFHYAYTPDRMWAYTSGRLWLEILPAVAVFIGGLMVLMSGHRALASFGAWLAVLGGAWFVVGGPLSRLWTATATPATGMPVGGPVHSVVEEIGFFAGLGAVIVFLAAVALGRFTVFGLREAAHRAGGPVAVPPQAAPPPGDERAPHPGDRAAAHPGDRAVAP